MSFLDIGTAIAAEMGQEWTAEPGYVSYTDHAILRHPDGRCLDLRSDNGSHRRSEHGRLIIRGSFGGLSGFGTAASRTHMITVAASRSPATIARDIARRLLPDYETDLAVCRTRDRAHHAAVARRDTTVEQLHRIFAHSQIIRNNHVCFGDGSDPISGTVRVLLNGGAEFTLTVSDARVLDLAGHITNLTAPVERGHIGYARAA
ncbi:hypothetical protein ABIA39_004511 [Nocardia sp. GAS34]|uniref:hypothetical protein n=1 Tax=unclassified Nocardia TaxID=2637762 RepID=UPI003D1BF3EB